MVAKKQLLVVGCWLLAGLATDSPFRPTKPANQEPLDSDCWPGSPRRGKPGQQPTTNNQQPLFEARPTTNN
jgi:hypothetical protein